MSKMGKKEDENAFEMIYREADGDITKEDLDKILDYLLDVNTKIFFWRLGLIVPLGVLIFQGIELIETYSPKYILHGSIAFLVLLLAFFIQQVLFIRTFKSMKTFKAYVKIRKKLKTMKEKAEAQNQG